MTHQKGIRFGVSLLVLCACLFMGTVPLRAAVFNIVDYGAKGDDSTDNTAAFSKCMEAVIAAGGGQMYLPAGVYRGRIIIHAVTVTGKHGFSIDQLDMEIAGKRQTDPHNAWQATAYNLNDPSNLGVGDINFWVVEGGVGAIESFTRNGGTGVRTRRVGSAP